MAVIGGSRSAAIAVIHLLVKVDSASNDVAVAARLLRVLVSFDRDEALVVVGTIDGGSKHQMRQWIHAPKYFWILGAMP